MNSKYDQNGKFFTHVISKEMVEVRVKTKTAIIEGEIYKKYDERILDSLNNGGQFIAMTHAVFAGEFDFNQDLEVIDFLVINRDQIEWVIPKD